MKTYFQKNKTFIPIYKGGHKIHKDDLLITAVENKIYFVNTTTGKIENEVAYNNNISYFTEHSNELIVGLVDGSLIHANKTCKPHKTKVSFIAIIDSLIVTTSFDKTMKVMNEVFETISTVYCQNSPLNIKDSDRYIMTYDVEGNIYLYEKNGGNRYRFSLFNDVVNDICYYDDVIYVFYQNRICKVYFNKKIGRLQASIFLDNKKSEVSAGFLDYEVFDHTYNISDVIIIEDKIYAVGDVTKVFVFDLACKIIDTKCIRIAGIQANTLEFKHIDFANRFVLTTTEDEILYIDDNFEIKNIIIGNNDEITDFCIYNETIFIATNSGRLRYADVIEREEGQYAFIGHILEGHDEAIMCIKIHNTTMITASRDKKLKIWKIGEEPETGKRIKFIADLNIRLLDVIETHVESVHSCDLTSNIIASVSKDQTLQIFKYEPSVIQTFNKIVHTKEINYVKICEERNLIITASQDKTLKVFDLNGSEIRTLNGHRRGVWSFDIGKDILASCSSDETARVWSLTDFSCIKILEGFNSAILKVKLYGNDTKLIAAGMNGVLKTWDIKRNAITGTYNIHTDKIWALVYFDKTIVTGASDGTLSFLKDETDEKSHEIKKQENDKIQMKFEIEKSIKNKDFLNALAISYKFDNIDEIYRLVAECINNNCSVNAIFEIFENDNRKIIKALSKYVKYFRFANVNQMLIRECLRRKWISQRDEALSKAVEKNYNALHDLYIDLLGYEITFKHFTEKGI